MWKYSVAPYSHTPPPPQKNLKYFYWRLVKALPNVAKVCPPRVNVNLLTSSASPVCSFYCVLADNMIQVLPSAYGICPLASCLMATVFWGLKVRQKSSNSCGQTIEKFPCTVSLEDRWRKWSCIWVQPILLVVRWKKTRFNSRPL